MFVQTIVRKCTSVWPALDTATRELPAVIPNLVPVHLDVWSVTALLHLIEFQLLPLHSPKQIENQTERVGDSDNDHGSCADTETQSRYLTNRTSMRYKELSASTKN